MQKPYVAPGEGGGGGLAGCRAAGRNCPSQADARARAAPPLPSTPSTHTLPTHQLYIAQAPAPSGSICTRPNPFSPQVLPQLFLNFHHPRLVRVLLVGV